MDTAAQRDAAFAEVSPALSNEKTTDEHGNAARDGHSENKFDQCALIRKHGADSKSLPWKSGVRAGYAIMNNAACRENSDSCPVTHARTRRIRRTSSSLPHAGRAAGG